MLSTLKNGFQNQRVERVALSYPILLRKSLRNLKMSRNSHQEDFSMNTDPSPLSQPSESTPSLSSLQATHPTSPCSKRDWVNIGFFTLLPPVTLTATLLYWGQKPVPWAILLFALVFGILTNLSITAGYHRLFSHRSYQAHPYVRWTLLFLASSAFQGSALKWSSDHRRHHLKVDTLEDPYSISKGFWYAHMGWLMVRFPNEKIHAPDLESDPLLRFQHRHYLKSAISAGFLFPALLGWILGDFWAGLIFAGFWRVLLTQQSTFFVNSLCHTLGKRPYSLGNTARDSWIVAFLTHGEGYHNYHHRFQTDYRNGIRWYHWDPTKWVIQLLSALGLAKNLKIVPQEEILKAKLLVDSQQMKSKGFSEETIQRLRARVLEAQNQIRQLKQQYHDYRLNQSLAAFRLEIKTAQIELRAGLKIWKAYLKSAQKNSM